MASLRKPTGSVPKATRHATAWDPAVVIFAPATVRCGPGYYCKEHIVVIQNGRDFDDPCEVI
jgi:hypothetical protein